jgi:hypothetical protein
MHIQYSFLCMRRTEYGKEKSGEDASVIGLTNHLHIQNSSLDSAVEVLRWNVMSECYAMLVHA